MTDSSISQWVEKHMQRWHKPDGYCLWCGRPADQFDPVGPLVVTIEAPDETEKHEFCNWVCFGHWAADAAGGDLALAAGTPGDLPEDRPNRC